MTETTTREGSAPLSEKGRRTKRPNRRKRAKQWTFLIEKLKLAVDGLYEMCREEQNQNGCKEALMYLQNSSRDFESLIASIDVELSWEEKEKPQAVAWEIRKSMSSPAPMPDASALMNQITPLMFSEVVKAASDRKKVAAAAAAASAAPAAGAAAQQHQAAEEKKQQDPLPDEVAAAAAAATGDDASKDEWQVVLRGRRKKSLSSLTSGSRDDLDTLEHTDPARPSNVYERLASSTRRYPTMHTTGRGLISASLSGQGSNYMCPKSAMDLPQTKASMAKMAYSRQLLWQRSQSTLLEKMKARQVRTRNADFGSAATGGGGGGQRQRVPVEKGTAAGGGVAGVGKTKSPSSVGGGGASDPGRNALTSIRETLEDERGEIIPVDPKPSSSSLTATTAATETREEKENSQPVQAQLRQQPMAQSECGGGAHQVQHQKSQAQLQRRDDDCLSFPLSNPELTSLNLECDREWREMTEEEESLAFEERSLNIEIEQEKSLSIDAELERQVAAEADALEREEEEQRARDEAEMEAEDEEEQEEDEAEEAEEEVAVEVEEERPKMTPEELAVHYNRWRDELLADLASASWSEMVERDLATAAGPATQYLREPGDAALRHERMMSPSRKREELSEEALSRKHELKQRRADELRERLKEEKAARLKALLQKVEEVREKRAALIERKRALMENRLRTANANRERNLEEIVRKAREDEMKVMEAQLIHTLEKGNMRMDQQKREQANESRRQEMKEERAKKQEEKAAKEAAAEERRKANDTRSECSVPSVCDEALAAEEREEEQRVDTPPAVIEEREEEEMKEEPVKADVLEQKEEEEPVEEVKKEEEKENEEEMKVKEEVRKEEGGGKKEKKRKTSKEKKKERSAEVKEEEKSEKREEAPEEAEYDWKAVIANWTAGGGEGGVLLADEKKGFRCTACDVKLLSEWEAVAHVISGGHEGKKKEEEEERKEKRSEEKKNEEEEKKEKEKSEEEVKETKRQQARMRRTSRRETVIATLCSSVRVAVRRQPEGAERRENVPANKHKKSRGAAKSRRGEAVRARDSAEALARAIGGGHGPSVDLWRDLLLAVSETPLLSEEVMRETTFFGKRNSTRKKAADAMLGFVEEYAGGKDDVLPLVLDAALRAITSDRPIRGGGGTVLSGGGGGEKRRDEKEAREIEEAAWCLLRTLAKEREDEFGHLLAPSSRSLRLAAVLLQRVDAARTERKTLKRLPVAGGGGGGRVGGSAASVGPLTTTLQPTLFQLLKWMAMIGGEEVQSVLLLLEAPRRLSTLPIAHLIQPPNRHILMHTLVAVTRNSEETLRDLQQHLSAWHIVQFLKSEVDRPKCICPLHTVLPTRESIVDAIQYYERAIL